MPRALISVSDKRGILPFAEGLARLGWEIVSTGGTATLLRDGGVAVTAADQVTGFPEMLDGRIKTLHPRIHAGILARPDRAEHLRQLDEQGITRFDLVAVNLYPFQATIANPGVKFEDAIENIDIGGPAMLRSAAKNFEFVLPVVDPKDYPRVIDLLSRGDIDLDIRRELAAKVFTHTADYDNAIAGYLTPWRDTLPARVTLSMERRQVLRYGENPQQRA
ncbi:MAG TPA: bifunctional phosphoribosylaminoimidazolecarboxamide formyltransferase/IMP cyclohydrolase, partial [Gemmatimonadales bacterium]